MKVKVVTKYACDFCEKDQDEVEKLILGLRSVAICNECVALCQELINSEKKTPAAGDKPEST